MTQQLDLALNMTSTTDKMMSNSTLSYSNKDSKELNNQFGNFLDNANKTYSNNAKTNDNKYENNKLYKHNERKDVKADKKEQSTIKSEEKSIKSYVQEDKSDTQNVSDISVNEQSNVQTFGVEEFVQVDAVEEAENIDEILQESILAANISDAVKLVNLDAVSTVENSVILNSDTVMELPADAISSGIQFNTDLTDVDVQDVDVDAVNNMTQNMNASKEDMIASLYNKNVSAENSKPDAKISENVLKASAEDVTGKDDKIVNTEVITDKKETIDAKNESILNAKPDENISVKQEVKLETNINLNVEETNNIAVESADIKDVNADLVKETAQKDEAVKEDIDTVQQVKQVEIVSQVNTDVENKQAVKDEAVSFQVKEIINEPVTKAEELKQEIDSAKLENIANNVQNQTDKKVADKNAKTIVESDETMDIKEDVSGIEFVNNKTKETDLKQEKTNDIHSDKIKQKVENVKIQVEENVKVNPQLVKTSEDINNAVKAQETLNKAGLTTENLQKMDAKIKDIDFSKNNAQSDLGQSSQEMLMRDMMQDSAQNPNSEAVELKVDFNQSLNKVLQANNTQQNLHPQEELQDVNILDQIRAKISLNGTNGMQKITIGLTPESLGKLHIEISKGMNGISAQIIADNPQAKEILDKNLDGLRSVLQSQGVNVNNVNVKVAEAGRSSEGNNNLFSNDEGQFNSNNNSHGSKNSSEGDREKRSEYEHLQQEAIKGENIENNSEPSEKNIYTEKTVSIKLNNGNVKYQL